jgi:hypothetical protein
VNIENPGPSGFEDEDEYGQPLRAWAVSSAINSLSLEQNKKCRAAEAALHTILHANYSFG